MNFNNLLVADVNGYDRYVGRECRPTGSDLLYFAFDKGYILLHPNQKWKMEYVPQKDTCFMHYKKLHVKINTKTFASMFKLTEDPLDAAKKEMDKVLKRGTEDG